MKSHSLALPANKLFKSCDPTQFKFDNTATLTTDRQSIGQERAHDAIKFGIDIQKQGYNLYLLGPLGVGKHTLVREILEQQPNIDDTMMDCCYVNNFEHSHRPLAMLLPAGLGIKLKKDLRDLTETLSHVIPKAFEAESYDKQVLSITGQYRSKEEHAFNEIEKKAKQQNIAFMQNDAEFSFAPLFNNEVMKTADYNARSEEEKEEIQKRITALQDELQSILQRIPKWQQESQDQIKELNAQIAKQSATFWIEELKRDYTNSQAVIDHIDAIEDDVIENVEVFLPQTDSDNNQNESPVDLKAFLNRYHLNLVVEHEKDSPAPIIYEQNPTLDNLIGKIDSINQYGTLVSDFSLIKAGALHKANGGYLVIDAYKLLNQPYAWEALKRALSTQEILIEPSSQSSMASGITLNPEAIPLYIKIILLGDHHLYFSLYEQDPQFNLLFKVVADFEDAISRDETSIEQFSEVVASISNSQELRAFDRTGVARLVEQSSRWIEDTEKLSTHIGELRDLMTEADYWAAKNDHLHVNSQDVNQAINQQQYRVARLKTEVQESILRGTTLIATSGETVGQVNGLTIASLGHFTFGQPSRISAVARLGDGKIIDIENESNLGGDIHTKGILILSSFFNARFVKEKSLSFTASIVFEQSYGEIDGDSASAAELVALLSAIAEIPIKQSIAVTGAINQHGFVQAIGGVNDKIEGFYDICKIRGLDGSHGVIIPEHNVKQLMLRQDIRESVKQNLFSVYAVNNIDQVAEILTGIPAGIRLESGDFEEDTINAKVENKLIDMAKLAHETDEHKEHEHHAE